MGGRTVAFTDPPSVIGSACIVGEKEGAGPLGKSFDRIVRDPFLGEKSWEKAESRLVEQTLRLALDKAEMTPSDVEYVFAGDLLSQCIGSTFGLRDSGIPVFGLFGACSTMAESLSLAAAMIDGGFAGCTAAVTSSHFCSAERQFRFPLEYGGQRTSTSQWTVTGAGAAILSARGEGPYVTHFTAGKIVDAGVKDANNMGAAMAPAAYDTLTAHFEDTHLQPSDYDLIVTGDLGSVGAGILVDLFQQDGVQLGPCYNDCGLMIFSEEQDVHAGGSGCGCSAAVLCGYLLNGMRSGRWHRILFAGTGALLSTVSSQQGESIPCVCCAAAISDAR